MFYLYSFLLYLYYMILYISALSSELFRARILSNFFHNQVGLSAQQEPRILFFLIHFCD